MPTTERKSVNPPVLRRTKRRGRRRRSCLYFGPLPGMLDLPQVVKALGGADAILLAPGAASHCSSVFEQRGAPAMILRLNFASNYLSNWNYTHSHSVPMLSVAEAVALGADIVLASLTCKTRSKGRFQECGITFHYVNEKRALGIPMVGEVFPTGGDDANPADLYELVRIAAVLRQR